MDHPEFDIRISGTGAVTVEVKGTSGVRCLALADLLAEIVGQEQERRLTSEYFTPDTKVRLDVHARDSGAPA